MTGEEEPVTSPSELNLRDYLRIGTAEYVHIQLTEDECRRLRIGSRETFIDRMDGLF
jgi:hypothetical protein